MKVPVGRLDISFYRDDVENFLAPVVHTTDIPFVPEGKTVVLVDDVLYLSLIHISIPRPILRNLRDCSTSSTWCS